MTLTISQVYQLFFAGIATGAVFTAVGLFLYYRAAVIRRKATITRMVEAIKATLGNAENDDVVTKRLLQVKEITMKQQDIRSSLEFPQKSAMDGKYKNRLVAEINALEDDKNAILLSILKDGHDPLVQAVDKDGSVETMKLSKFCELMDLKAPANNEKPAPKEEKLAPNVRKVGKFTVYSNNSDDEGTSH